MPLLSLICVSVFGRQSRLSPLLVLGESFVEAKDGQVFALWQRIGLLCNLFNYIT